MFNDFFKLMRHNWYTSWFVGLPITIFGGGYAALFIFGKGVSAAVLTIIIFLIGTFLLDHILGSVLDVPWVQAEIAEEQARIRSGPHTDDANGLWSVPGH